MARTLPTVLLAPLLLLAACAGGGPHFPRPEFRAAGATVRPGQDVQVELLAINPTEAPLWLKGLDLTLTADEAELALGTWEGSRQIDPNGAAVLDIALPLTESAILPATETRGALRLKTHYARSGIIGVLGGESHTYTLPIAIRPGD